MLKNVAILVYDGVAPFELGVLCEAWAIDRSTRAFPTSTSPSARPSPVEVPTEPAGRSPRGEHGLDRLADADLICMPAMPRDQPVPAEVLDALRAADARGARFLSRLLRCLRAGRGRPARRPALHHPLALRRRARGALPATPRSSATCCTSTTGRSSPRPARQPGSTPACTSSVSEFGASVAATVARRMVVAPHRDGGQAQFIESPVPVDDRRHAAAAAGVDVGLNLHEDLSVERLAARRMMAPRTFARRFKAETGTTPYHWITNQRVMLAERMLEESDETIERIATRAGFSNATAFRHHFARLRGTSPQHYRRIFKAPAATDQPVAQLTPCTMWVRVGLTGGIGSGKSSVSALLAEHGAVVIDADLLAREVVARRHAGPGRGRRLPSAPGARPPTESSTGPSWAAGVRRRRGPRPARGDHPPARAGPRRRDRGAAAPMTRSSCTTSRCWSRPARPSSSTPWSWSTRRRTCRCSGWSSSAG